MADDKLTQIDCKPHKLAVLLAAARAELTYQIELQQLMAKITRAKYEALVKEGFTPEQAICLCENGNNV